MPLTTLSIVDFYSDVLDALASNDITRLDVEIACKNAIAKFAHVSGRAASLREPRTETFYKLSRLHGDVLATRRELLNATSMGLHDERAKLARAMQEENSEAERKMLAILQRLHTFQQPLEDCVRSIERALTQDQGPKDLYTAWDTTETLVDDTVSVGKTLHPGKDGIWDAEEVRAYFGKKWEEMRDHEGKEDHENGGLNVVGLMLAWKAGMDQEGEHKGGSDFLGLKFSWE